MRDREGLADEDLVRKIDEIDLRDGVLNGRRAKQVPMDCPKCDRTLPKRQPVCIYCGTDAGIRDPFGSWSVYDRTSRSGSGSGFFDNRGRLASIGRIGVVVACRGASRPRKKDAHF